MFGDVLHYLPSANDLALHWSIGLVIAEREGGSDVTCKEIAFKCAPLGAKASLGVIAPFNSVSSMAAKDEVKNEASAGTSEIEECDWALELPLTGKYEPRASGVVLRGPPWDFVIVGVDRDGFVREQRDILRWSPSRDAVEDQGYVSII